MSETPETANVAVELTGVEYVRKGALLALVSFQVTIAGVEIRVQGAQIRRREHGQIELTAPMFRSATGVWLPAIELPDAAMKMVLELLGSDWKEPGRMRLMVTSEKPDLTLAFAPTVEATMR